MNDIRSKAVEKAVEELSPKFDGVIILASISEGGVTKSVIRRGGNYYACKGIVTEWLEQERNGELAKAIKEDE